tara:strand:- start:4909 stop:5631 length:723 start_codon:yes stop_codon:yes gene_type:complete
MGYSTLTDITNTIAQALTTATNPTSSGRRSLLEVGRVLDENLVTSDIVEWYIARSDEEINSFLSELYVVPLCEIADFEASVLSNVDEYNSFIVLEEACPLNPGDIIILKFGNNEERHEIDEVIDAFTFSTVGGIGFAFPSGTRLIRVKYPEPIRLVSARLAAANIYDKYFSSQAAPNVSNYGKYIREQAYAEMDNVLNGRTILHGQHRIGRRFWNSNLDDRYALPNLEGSVRDLNKLGQG